MVLVNEIFANTGFQYSPATMPFADTSTTPAEGTPGNLNPPLDYIHLAHRGGGRHGGAGVARRTARCS